MPLKGYKQSKEHIAKLIKKRLGRIPKNKTNVFKVCNFCNIKFRIKPCLIKTKFCSKNCYSEYQKTIPPWNKGIKTGAIPKTAFKKGISYSPENQFKPGVKPHNYKGFSIKEHGYVILYKPNHPSCSRNGYVKRSRITVETYLKRFLLRTEIVHHINEIKDDDRIENLMVFSSHSAHGKFHFYKNRVKEQEIIFDGSKLKFPLNNLSP